MSYQHSKCSNLFQSLWPILKVTKDTHYSLDSEVDNYLILTTGTIGEAEEFLIRRHNLGACYQSNRSALHYCMN